MRRRTNFAPTATTIVIALVFIVLGLIGTYTSVVPLAVGLLAYVAATVLLLAGMVFRGI